MGSTDHYYGYSFGDDEIAAQRLAFVADTPMSVPVVLAWSGGKDSALALWTLRHDPRFKIRALLTTLTEGYEPGEYVRRPGGPLGPAGSGRPPAGHQGPYPTRVDPGDARSILCRRSFDERLLADLPQGVDPCGENGEFHTVVHAGPIFHEPISCEIGEIVTREGFVFCDVLPLGEPEPASVI